MELAQELFVTAVIAVLFSFLIAKLVSMAMADSSEDSNKRADQELVPEEIIMEDLPFYDERLQVEVTQSEERAEFVVENLEKVDEIVQNPVGVPVEGSESECVGLNEGSVEKEGSKGGELTSEKKREFGEKVGGDGNVVEQSGEVVGKKEREFDQEVIKEEPKLESSVEESREGEEPIGVVEVTEDKETIALVEERELKEEVEVEEEKKVEILVSSDDDWEGIERSELEKVFAEAVKFVESSSSSGDSKDERLAMASVGSEVEMELYGLHKVATEGPCREQPPLPLMVSARAKWY